MPKNIRAAEGAPVTTPNLETPPLPCDGTLARCPHERLEGAGDTWCWVCDVCGGREPCDPPRETRSPLGFVERALYATVGVGWVTSGIGMVIYAAVWP